MTTTPRNRQRRQVRLSREFWTDHSGRRWRVPAIRDRLRPHQIRGHAALKAFIICRDGGRCVRCGSTSDLVADHRVSKRNGGSHHPDNLQCLCKPCNDRKSNWEDRGRA